ncbi:hypothetical protein AALP_AA4G257100 [Arabis alpina]|uniref:Uncharacterized protein n=1 Tax=Arabis alpina TaxID=50452 RepID=A0A087H5N7_ARAAL|nr:hypothetical protein AALP_AA4G257100 [Arabis alpina]
MWTIKPALIPVQFLRQRTGATTVGYPQPPPHNHKAKSQSSDSIGGLGQQILLCTTEPNQNKPVLKEKEITGSDVLWAIQRATAQKKKSIGDKRKKKKITGVVESSSTVECTGDNGVNYSNVTPLKIKSDWGQRLEEYEKVLKELQDTEV